MLGYRAELSAKGLGLNFSSLVSRHAKGTTAYPAVVTRHKRTVSDFKRQSGA